MERQQEYELRKKIADAIQNDVDRVFSEKLQLFNHDFYYPAATTQAVSRSLPASG